MYRQKNKPVYKYIYIHRTTRGHAGRAYFKTISALSLSTSFITPHLIPQPSVGYKTISASMSLAVTQTILRKLRNIADPKKQRFCYIRNTAVAAIFASRML